MSLKHLTVCAPLLLGGCMSMTRPITVKDALENVEQNLIAARVIPVSATTLSNPAEAAVFDNNVLVAQCSQNRADPSVALMRQSVSLHLSGSFTSSADFSITGIGGGSVLGGIDGSVNQAKSQQLDIPIDFIVLTQVPDTVASDRIKSASQDRVDGLTAARDALQLRIDTLVKGFMPAACSQTQKAGTAAGLMTTKTPQGHYNDDEN